MMKNRVRRDRAVLIVVGLLAALLLLVSPPAARSQPGGLGDAVPTNVRVSYEHDFFATNNPARYGALRFDAPDSLVLVGEVVPARWLTGTNEGLTWFFSDDENDNLFFHGFHVGRDTVAYDPPVMWLPGDVDIGSSWSEESLVGGESYRFDFAVPDSQTVIVGSDGLPIERLCWRVERTINFLGDPTKAASLGPLGLGPVSDALVQGQAQVDSLWYELDGLPRIEILQRGVTDQNEHRYIDAVVPVPRSSVGGFKQRFRPGH